MKREKLMRRARRTPSRSGKTLRQLAGTESVRPGIAPAAHLNTLSTPQRQTALQQLGQVQGNAYVQRLVRSLQNGVQTVIQRASLDDYKDPAVPAHDPAKISDVDIKATDEYDQLLNDYGLMALADFYSESELLLACRLIIRRLREGGTFDYDVDAKTFLERARQQLGALAGVEQTGGDLAGKDSAEWNQQSLSLQGTDFGKWLLGGGKEPDPKKAETMNCWEVVLFGGYKAGYINKAWLVTFYKQLQADLKAAGKNVMDNTTIEKKLITGREYELDPADPDSPEPLAGDIVIFETALRHTAISLGSTNGAGEHEVLSLWNTPNNNLFVQKTTVEALLGAGASSPVYFWSPKWK